MNNLPYTLMKTYSSALSTLYPYLFSLHSSSFRPSLHISCLNMLSFTLSTEHLIVLYLSFSFQYPTNPSLNSTLTFTGTHMHTLLIPFFSYINIFLSYITEQGTPLPSGRCALHTGTGFFFSFHQSLYSSNMLLALQNISSPFQNPK